jgi:hypothetical protein
MTVTSPSALAAQAVMGAVIEICPAPADEIAAAALRAVVETTKKRQYGDCWICDAADLLAIADQLKGAS